MTSSDRLHGKQPKNIPSPNDTAGKNYNRFIPREEIGSFAAWNPGDLGGPGAPTHPLRRASDEPIKPQQVDVAEQIAAQMRATRQAGYQDGYRDGLVALDGFKQSFAQQMSAQIGALVASIGGELGALQQEMARTLAISATNLARRVVRSELTTRPELVVQVAQEAVDTMLLSAQHITVRVHPDDHALVAAGAAEVLKARGGRVVSDSGVTRGGCLVESDIGVIDASVETRWRRAAASLGIDESFDADEDSGPDTRI
jgi:flagellar assembly protein FliH